MTDLNYELSYLSAGLEELEPYLLSDELFWHVSTPPHLHTFPMLTIGNLLLTSANLKGLLATQQLSPTQKTEYARFARRLQEMRRKWAVAWEKKAAHEYQSRLRQWLIYLNELKSKPDDNAPYYSTEVRNRALLELLKDSSPESAQPDIKDLDAVLRAKLTGSDFIWAEEIQPGFPQEEFWFLYGKP